MEKFKQLIIWALGKFDSVTDWVFDPTNQFLGIVLGSLFTLLGVVFANRNSHKLAFQQNVYEHKNRKKELVREKLEELYLQVSQWKKILGSKSLSHMSAMHGDISYNDYLDKFIEESERTEFKLEKLELLSSVYAPEIAGQLEVCKEYMRERIHPMESEFRKHYEEYGEAYTGDERSEKITSYAARCSAFDDLIDHLRKQISEKIRNEL